MIRVRFKANFDDPAPHVYPPHPYWCVGYDMEDEWSLIVAYADSEAQIKRHWPEATAIEVIGRNCTRYAFSPLFPRPFWFFGKNPPERNP